MFLKKPLTEENWKTLSMVCFCKKKIKPLEGFFLIAVVFYNHRKIMLTYLSV